MKHRERLFRRYCPSLKNTHFPFVKWLSKKLDIEQTPLGIEMLKDLYDQFGAAEKDCWNKMHLGIQLLSGYGRDRTKMLQEESDIPSYNRLAIEVGMIAIGNDTNQLATLGNRHT